MVDMLTSYQSPVGELTLASNGEQLIGLWIADQKYFGSTLEQNTIETNELPIFKKTKTWLDQYFSGQSPDIANLDLAPRGSEFRQIVWQLLAEIPYGEVITYGSIAQKVAQYMGKSSMSSQAVGTAIAHNPISIIIACHRVVASTGDLTGYAGGIANKAYLLTLEGVDMKKLFVP